jgi:CBS domain containing-hemolysin-like protein
VDVIGVQASDSVQAMLDLARQTGKSRFPVYVDTLDSVVGIVSVIDGFGVPVGRRDLTPVGSVAREPVLVPESLDLDGVLDALQAVGADAAIVVDEYGGTDGLVTVEDLVEELVGDIADEHDSLDPILGTLAPAPGLGPLGEAMNGQAPASEQGVPVRAVGVTEVTEAGGARTILVDGVLREDELAEATGFRLPEGPYETLAGFLMARLGHIPAVGETVVEGDWEFAIVEVHRRRVEQVRVLAPTPDEESSR